MTDPLQVGAVAIDPDWLRTHPLPQPDEGGDKDGRGSVLVIGGCAEVPGAVRLAGEAALRAGAGRLRLATARSVAPHLALAVPESLVIALDETETGCIAATAPAALREKLAHCDTLLLGPGLMAEEEAALTAEVLTDVQEGCAVVLDAAALSGLAAQPELVRRHRGRAVITPHAGEMARLLDLPRDEVEADPLAAAHRAAEHLACVVVMKGSRTHVVAPGGIVLVSDHGHVGLATSGSGDTLAGMIAGLLARGTAPLTAAAWGVWVHAEAGHRLARRLGPLGFLARELPGEVPAILADLAPA
ncbi:NAD(P)H-hydrate dehydratase [Muricoccus radiodurans]|uniref:NAD(P)H-hydrate dehydratase n=1 Tax=Muricoccus radiodurans TaxID=2231721 RepID=UPI003CF5AC15